MCLHEMNLTRPSESSFVRARELAANGKVPTLYSAPDAFTCERDTTSASNCDIMTRIN